MLISSHLPGTPCDWPTAQQQGGDLWSVWVEIFKLSLELRPSGRGAPPGRWCIVYVIKFWTLATEHGWFTSSRCSLQVDLPSTGEEFAPCCHSPVHAQGGRGPRGSSSSLSLFGPSVSDRLVSKHPTFSSCSRDDPLDFGIAYNVDLFACLFEILHFTLFLCILFLRCRAQR